MRCLTADFGLKRDAGVSGLASGLKVAGFDASQIIANRISEDECASRVGECATLRCTFGHGLKGAETMTLSRMAFLAIACAGLATAASAQTGPVAAACKDDIAKYCAGKTHDGEVRACLTAAKGKVSAACRTALDTTGPRKGQAK
jgi:hypothetical protein